MESKLKQFWENGYMVVKNCVNDVIIDSVVNNVEELEYLSIFETTTGLTTVYDSKRFQGDFSESPLRAFSNLKNALVRDVIRPLRMRWIPKNWVVLKSLPNGVEQEAHRDFPSFEIGRARNLYQTCQAGLLLALMDNTKFVVYDKCFVEKDPKKRTVLTFEKGDCILFRGDLVHSGASFETLNYRVHVSLIVKNIVWDNNATENAPSKTFKCSFCRLIADTKRKIFNHSRTCQNNPKRAEIKAQIKLNNDKIIECKICNKSMKKVAFLKHRQRKHKGVVV